jgi:hypothetical protein
VIRVALERELASLLNRHSCECAPNTPDFALAQYLLGCLDAFTTAVQQRDTFHGRDARPSAPSSVRGGSVDCMHRRTSYRVLEDEAVCVDCGAVVVK